LWILNALANYLELGPFALALLSERLSNSRRQYRALLHFVSRQWLL
jgi:hypothetical protein